MYAAQIGCPTSAAIMRGWHSDCRIRMFVDLREGLGRRVLATGLAGATVSVVSKSGQTPLRDFWNIVTINL